MIARSIKCIILGNGVIITKLSKLSHFIEIVYHIWYCLQFNWNTEKSFYGGAYEYHEYWYGCVIFNRYIVQESSNSYHQMTWNDIADSTASIYGYWHKGTSVGDGPFSRFWNYKLKYTNTADDTGAGPNLALVGVDGNCTNVVITGSTSTLKKDYRNYGIVYLIGGILNMSFMEEHIP